MQNIRRFASAGFVLLVPFCAPAYAATLNVTNLNDSGAGSLRGTLASAGSGDTIVFAPGVTGTIALVSSLSITQSVTIQGPGAANLTLSGQNAVRVINVTAGNLTLSGVTVANGATNLLGGGINNADTSTLTISNCAFSGNAAANGGGISNPDGGTLLIEASTFQANTATSVGGGGVITFGTATVRNSTFAGNTAPLNGGAINVQSTGILTLINSTLANNTSGGLGGAMSSLGTFTAINDTFAANTGSSGGAIAVGNANLTIYNSVFADNIEGALNPALIGGTTSNNVFYNNTVSGVRDDLTGYGTSNFIAATAQPLTALGNNGGPTQTMMPRQGRAAICAGSVPLLPNGLTQDQRGLPRTTSLRRCDPWCRRCRFNPRPIQRPGDTPFT